VRYGGTEKATRAKISLNPTPLLITRSAIFPSLDRTRMKVRIPRERKRMLASSSGGICLTSGNFPQ
jgi:hypothetical protein